MLHQRLMACAYIRVSTFDHTKRQLSLKSQLAAIEDYCLRHRISFADVIEEKAMTSSDHNRPLFMLMMDRATSVDRLFDVIVVYSPSRFASDLTVRAATYDRLRTAKVRLLSVTEELEDSSTGTVTRKILADLQASLNWNDA